MMNMASLPEAVIRGLTPDVQMDQTHICLKNSSPLSILGVASGRLLAAKVYPLKAFNKHPL